MEWMDLLLLTLVKNRGVPLLDLLLMSCQHCILAIKYSLSSFSCTDHNPRKLLLLPLVPHKTTMIETSIALIFSVFQATLVCHCNMVLLSCMQYSPSTIMHCAFSQYSSIGHRRTWLIRFTLSFDHFCHHELTSRLTRKRRQQERPQLSHKIMGTRLQRYCQFILTQTRCFFLKHCFDDRQMGLRLTEMDVMCDLVA